MREPLTDQKPGAKPEKKPEFRLPWPIAAALSVAVIAGAVFVLNTYSEPYYAPTQTPRFANFGRAPAGQEEGQKVEVAKTRSGVRAYSFKRILRAELSGQPVLDMTLGGSLWTADQSVYVRFESPEAFRGTSPVRISIEESGKLTAALSKRGPQGRASAPRADQTAMLARLAIDLVDQFRFFEKKDLQGAFSAEVHRVTRDHYVKKKRRYLDGPLAEARIETSRHELRLTDQEDPREIRGEETLLWENAEVGFRSKTSYEIRYDDAALASALAFLDGPQSWTPVSSEQLAQAAQASAGLENVPSFGELAALLQSGRLRTVDERHGVFRGLVKRLDAEDGSARAARAVLESVRERPEDAQLMIGALASSSREEAQRALAEFYRDSDTRPHERQAALNAWITTSAPLGVAATELLLEESGLGRAKVDASSPSARGALLALGAQVAKIEDPARKKELEDLLIARLESAEREGERIAALDSIGNSASVRLLPYVRDYLSDGRDRVRARAYLALRAIPGEDVSRLIEGGRQDPSREVQDSVERALEQRRSVIN